MVTSQDNDKSYERQILNKLKAKKVKITDDWDRIRKCLENTVAPSFCLRVAMNIRKQRGILT